MKYTPVCIYGKVTHTVWGHTYAHQLLPAWQSGALLEACPSRLLVLMKTVLAWVMLQTWTGRQVA